jgi:hypothetical protein
MLTYVVVDGGVKKKEGAEELEVVIEAILQAEDTYKLCYEDTNIAA